MDFCKNTPIEPQKRVVRVVRPNFNRLDLAQLYMPKNAIFGHFNPLPLIRISQKTLQSFKNINDNQCFYEIWRSKSG